MILKTSSVLLPMHSAEKGKRDHKLNAQKNPERSLLRGNSIIEKIPAPTEQLASLANCAKPHVTFARH